ncbi:MAG: UDP-glucose 4-epimerase GalE [Puniceicoccales bacterium]|jgi:UDP-glucose 4-epimerase|nr:UDP-glucose 4-epimerase GalE [Puniceicoccales bacterium]
MKLFVTGGAGYIGSHCVLRLLQEGHEVVIFDNFSEGSRETVRTLSELKFPGRLADVVQGDLLHPEDLQRALSDDSFDAVFHFAALTRVKESVQHPELYYCHNVVGTLNLLEAMRSFDVKRLVFSSTASVYGEPQYTPIDEKHPLNPINPYGRSKQMAEMIIQDFDRAYGIRSVCLRYFNVVGASSLGCLGDRRVIVTHLIPSIIHAILGISKAFSVFGTDYPTRDGTCIRDYIPIEDLVDAHIRALTFLSEGNRTEIFNLGTEQGYTVQEVLTVCERVLGKKIPVILESRRSGDPAVLIAASKRANEALNWHSQQLLEEAIRLAYAWEQKKMSMSL